MAILTFRCYHFHHCWNRDAVSSSPKCGSLLNILWPSCIVTVLILSWYKMASTGNSFCISFILHQIPSFLPQWITSLLPFHLKLSIMISRTLLPLAVLICFVVTGASSTMKPKLENTIPLSCTKSFYRKFVGCVCYLRYLGILKRFDNLTRKVMFCKRGLGEKDLNALRHYCIIFQRKKPFRISRVLKFIHKRIYVCNSVGIKHELPSGSIYEKLL